MKKLILLICLSFTTLAAIPNPGDDDRSTISLISKKELSVEIERITKKYNEILANYIERSNLIIDSTSIDKGLSSELDELTDLIRDINTSDLSRVSIESLNLIEDRINNLEDEILEIE